MPLQQDVIEQLEDAFARRDVGRRTETLQRITDLFVSTASSHSAEQVELFDEVMRRLLVELETSGRAAYGQRMAKIADAPPAVMRALALDDALEVAAPVLQHSEGLEEEVLVESAKTKGQGHLMAISRRKRLAEAVTDVLVERGDSQVALSTAQNPGAQFSDFGFSTLVKRSQEDDDLAITVWSRPEIPRQHQLHLFDRASEAVRAKFEFADPRKAALIRGMVAHASDQIQTKARNIDGRYAAARAHVEELKAAGRLDEGQLATFARARNFDAAAVALSLMADLPIGLVERAIVNERPEQVFVLTKAIGLTWETTEAILRLQAGPSGKSRHDLEQCRAAFARLQAVTATKALSFYRLREKAAGSAG
ncbi:MAG TPA: DUF2336 domain-containing protein [Xanthobacteraceae bacterium]|nr:DUF2336 domain-containing protein [Xanthobacteraceae bacterium]